VGADSGQGSDFSLAGMQVVIWLLALALPLAAGLAFSWAVAWAVLVGAVLANLSFILLKNDLNKIMRGPVQAVKVRFFIKYYLRLSAMALVLYVLIRYGRIHVLGLLVGLSTVVLGVVIAAFRQSQGVIR